MNKRDPGENFKQEAESFVEEVKQMAQVNFQKLITLSRDFGQKLQKTFNPTPGIGGNSTSTKTRPVQNNDGDRDDGDKAQSEK